MYPTLEGEFFAKPTLVDFARIAGAFKVQLLLRRIHGKLLVTMAGDRRNKAGCLLRWRDVYREAELYKSAVRVYTKPLFLWRRALNVSTDGRTLYDLASRGLKGLSLIHEQLRAERFHFRPSVGLKYNFNGKRRTLYIPPWEERIVDLLIYRLLNRRLHHWFSPSSYAYRDHTYGLDRCQSRITAALRSARVPVYVVKRDISDYFASVIHEILRAIAKARCRR